MKLLRSFLLLIIITMCSSEKVRDERINKPLPYFRRQVEELFEDTPAEKKFDDQQNNLVSFLVNNVKEIFNLDTEKDLISALEPSDDLTHVNPKYRPNLEPNTVEPALDIIPRSTETSDVISYGNISVIPMPFLIARDAAPNQILFHTSTDIIATIAEITEDDIENTVLIEELHKKTIEKTNSAHETDKFMELRRNIGSPSKERSCIFCNNVENENCGDPKNKLIPSIICENLGDLCYSQHTPFGIIERGCFDDKRNETMYVCVCDLCNSIPIAEMPMTYSQKSDWIEEVMEHSNFLKMKNPVFRIISCLSCEVNSAEDLEHDKGRSCYEGDITTTKSVKCKDTEVCGIKAIRSQFYLWRGCLKRPLYNYWLSLCDEDLCNYDPPISLFDL